MTCKCDFRTRMVGDGCDVCNPAKALEFARETIGDNKAMCKDAERYRWLRHGDNDELCIRLTTLGEPYMLRGDLLDNCIDDGMAAIAAQEAKGITTPQAASHEAANEIERLRLLTFCGCGDQFTFHDPGTCGNCCAGMQKMQHGV